MLIDTHAHLDFLEFAEDLDHVLLRAKQAGLERIITIGTTLLSSRKAIELAERYPQIYASVGIHPNSASQEREDFLSELEGMVKHSKVVAVGETGLDYYRLASKQEESEVSQTAFGAASFTTIGNEIRDEAEIAAQSATFEQHLELAAAAGKSVVIHQRDSWEDTIEILRKYSTRVRAVMHCFDAGLPQAQEAVDLGHFVSFSGIVTFENTSEVREAAKSIPIERIMVESDSPFLAPAPYRGRRCEPAFVRETAAFIANLRGMSLAAFAAQTTQNAQEFFGLS
ncbi:MAG: TatD family hydrolase [Chthoniobacterales bacterium]